MGTPMLPRCIRATTYLHLKIEQKCAPAKKIPKILMTGDNPGFRPFSEFSA